MDVHIAHIHPNTISHVFDRVCTDYENLILLGDFTVETEEKHISDFMSVYNLKNLIRHKTCFRNSGNPSSFETGLSDCHKCQQQSLSNTFPNKNPR